MTLPFEERPNPHGRNLTSMKLFRVARVRALALRVHGGLYGQWAHLKKLAETAAKAKETKKKNGTMPVKKHQAASSPVIRSRFILPTGFPILSSTVLEDYDDDEYYDEF